MKSTILRVVALMASFIPIAITAQVTATFSVEMPKHRLYADAGPDQQLGTFQTIKLGGEQTAFGGSGEYAYQWSPSKFLDNNHSPNPTLKFLEQRTTFKVTVTDLGTGCTQTDEVVVNVATEKSNLKEIDIKLFPNPFKNVVQINSNQEIAFLTVMDMTGRTVLQREFDEEMNTTITTDQFNSGIYLFQFKLTNGTTKTLKLCKAE